MSVEALMRFDPELYDKETEREFQRFFRWTSEQTWRQKIGKLERSPRFSEADAYRQYLRQRNPLTVTIEHYFNLIRSGKTAAKHFDNFDKRVCGYIKLVNYIAHGASPAVLNRVKGSVLDDESVKGFLFELDIAIHFLRLGYDVKFADLEGIGQYDLLVCDGETELEVECKRKSIDAGRKIKKGDFYLLADILFEELKDSARRFAVFIRSEGRMGANQDLYRSLAKTVQDLLNGESGAAYLGNLEVKIAPLPEDLQVRSEAEARVIFGQFQSTFSYYAVLSGRETTIIIGCESAEPNKVLDAIYDELKRGASQLSGDRPALLGCLIEEVEDKDWKELQGGSGLQAVAARLLDNPMRRHVNLLAFSSDRTPPKREENVISFGATHFDFWHGNPKFSLPKSFIFRS
jgi:hypothetical protein